MQNNTEFTTLKLLTQSLENQVSRLDQGQAQILQTLYHIKGKAIASFLQGNEGYLQTINKLEANLKPILEPALMDDPMIVKAENKPDLDYQIGGYTIKFKVDTGAVTSVVDAEDIDWPLSEEQRKLLEQAYELYVDKYPDDGAMTKDKLAEFDAVNSSLDFGRVLNFSLITHRKGKDDTSDKSDKEKDTQKIILSDSFDVVGISNPKVKGERLGLRPVINLPIQGPGFEEGSVYPFSLVKRDMTRRGLVSRTQLKQAKMSIIFDDRDTRILDAEKVDFFAVWKCMQAYTL